jgi:hypothetical protein
MNTDEVGTTKLTGEYYFKRHWLLRTIIVLWVEEEVQVVTHDSQLSKPFNIWRKANMLDVIQLFKNPTYYKLSTKEEDA